VERDAHDSISGIECFLYAIAVVNIDIDVQHAFVDPNLQLGSCESWRSSKARRRKASVLEQLQDGQHNIVDVAEARGLALLCVMQAAGPVDGYIRVAIVQANSSTCCWSHRTSTSGTQQATSMR